MKTHLMTREDLCRAEQLGHEIMNDATVSDDLRKLARKVHDAAGFSLCYDELCTGEIPAEPWGFAFPDFYEVEVVQPFIAQLPDTVRDEDLTLIEMTHKAAKVVDHHGFSLTHRLDGLDALNGILAELKHHADEYESELQGAEL